MTDLAHVTNPVDLDKLIQNFEYENQQYVKLIEKENQQIEAIEKEIEEKKNSVEKFQESISQLDEDTKRAHKQFTQNRDNCDSLKKTLTVLKDHEEALERRLSSVLENQEKERQERDGIMKHYQDILLDYEVKYKSFPLAKVLEEKNSEVANLENIVKDAECRIQVLKSNIQDMEDNSSEDYCDWIKFVVKIAGLKIDTENLKKQVFLLTNEKKDTDIKIEHAHQKVLEAEQERKQVCDKEGNSLDQDETGQNEDQVEREEEMMIGDTSLNDFKISMEQSDDEESTLISIYAGKEEVESRFINNRQESNSDSVPQFISANMTVEQPLMQNSIPHSSIVSTTSQSEAYPINQIIGKTSILSSQIMLSPVSSHITTSQQSGHIITSPDSSQSTDHLAKRATAYHPGNASVQIPSFTFTSPSPVETEQVPQIARPGRGPKLISYRPPVTSQIYFKSPSVPVISPVKTQIRSNTPNVTSPVLSRPEKGQFSIPSSPQRPPTNTTPRLPFSIMSPRPAIPSSQQIPASTVQNKPQTSSINKPALLTTMSMASPVPNQAHTRSQQQYPFTLHTKETQQPVQNQLPKKSQLMHGANRHQPIEPAQIAQSSHMMHSSTTPSHNQSVMLPVHSQAMQHIPKPNQSAYVGQQSARISQASTNSMVNQSLQQQNHQIITANSPKTPSPKSINAIEMSPEPYIPSKSPGRITTPEHQIKDQGNDDNRDWSPFNMEKHQHRLSELKNKSPGYHLFDKRPMFDPNDKSKSTDKEEVGSFMTSFFGSGTGEKNDFSMGGAEMNLFGSSGGGGGGASLFGDSSANGGGFFGGGMNLPDKSGSSGVGFNFGGNSGNSGGADSPSIMSLFGGGESNQEQKTQETSFSFSFGGGGNTNDTGSKGFSLF